MLQKVTAHVIKGSGGDQLPWVTTSLTADFFLVHGSAGSGSEQENYSASELQSIIDKHKTRSDGEISLAILPFTNLTGDKSQDYIVKGQNEALYTELCQLGQVKPIRVVGGRTSAAIADREMSIPELARKFNVDFLVEASVMTLNDSVILQLRLIEAYPEEKPVFARTYTSSLRDILKLHSNIAGQIAEKIDLELTPEELTVLPESRSVNPDAYKEYLRGMFHLSQLTPESIENGLKHLHEAVNIDPGESFAYAGLALGYLDIAHGPLDPGGSMEKAEAAARQAELIDPNLPEVYAALGQIYYYRVWDFVKAEEYLKMALALNPNLAITHYHYSWLLYSQGRMEEAIAEHKLAQKYDPFRAGNTAWLGGLYLYAERYEDGIEECMNAIELNKDFLPSYYILGECFLGLGRKEEALETHKELYKTAHFWSWPLCKTYVSLGMIEEAETLLDEYEKMEVIPFVAINRCIMNATLGNLDEAFKWLNYKPNHVWLAGALRMPEFEALRKDPRFEQFKAKFILPEE
jgi:TolB-like protein